MIIKSAKSLLSKQLNSFKSRTIRFFTLAGAAWATVPELLPFLREQLPDFQQYLPDNFYKILSIVVILGGVYYRFRTVSAVPGTEKSGAE